MGILTKLFKTTAKSADDLFSSKAVRKNVAKKASRATEAFTNRGTMKTTSAVAKQGVSQATAGGRKMIAESAKRVSQGAGSMAKVGGKVVAGTGIASIPVLSGVGLYNYYKNSTALTDEDRRLNFLFDKAKEASDAGFDASTGDPNVDRDPTSRGNTGVGGTSPYGVSGAGFNPFSEAYGDAGEYDDTSSGSPLLLIGGVAVAGIIGYSVYKNRKKIKKAVSK